MISGDDGQDFSAASYMNAHFKIFSSNVIE